MDGDCCMTNNKTVCLTGSQGFLGGYLCKELLDKGYRVIGFDNFSKYGRVKRAHDDHPNFELMEVDLADLSKASKLTLFNQFSPDYIIAGAAMIGGISYFHKYAYDLLAINERIISNTFDMAIDSFKNDNLKRIVVISSSMVYEGADSYFKDYNGTYCSALGDYQVNLSDDEYESNETVGIESTWPTREGREKIFPPPLSTYGFQKLSCEYFCKGAAEQYGLPYTIVRPFNAVGIGEEDALGEEEVLSGNVKLMMSHVLPDLINKCLRGQDPLHILGDGSQIRCYTNGRDIARGIVMAMESEAAENEDFNISTERQTTVMELARLVWGRINPNKPFSVINDPPYTYDVQKRIPDVTKAARLLGFETTINLEESIDEVIEYMRNHGNTT